MSKGLGKVERFVLESWSSIDAIASQMSHERWLAEDGLMCTGMRDCCELGPYAVGIPLRAEYESVRRAVRSLERKGPVTTRWQADDSGPGSPRPASYLWIERTKEGEAILTRIRAQRRADFL